jgi:hypothetical protein
LELAPAPQVVALLHLLLRPLRRPFRTKVKGRQQRLTMFKAKRRTRAATTVVTRQRPQRPQQHLQQPSRLLQQGAAVRGQAVNKARGLILLPPPLQWLQW